MKNLRKMLLGMVAAMVLALCLVPTAAVHVEAESEIKYLKDGFNITAENDVVNIMGYYIYLDAFRKGSVKDIKIKLSNKKIISASGYSGDSDEAPYILFIPKKTGKTEITITAKVNGKKVTCKGTVNVVKTQKGFSKLKLGGKSYLKDLKYNYSTIILRTKKKTTKLDYKLSSGWKIKAVSFYDGKKERDYTKKFKSGTSLQSGLFPADEGGIYEIELRNKKLELPHFVYIYIYND